MPIYSHHGRKGSHPYNTPRLLFCHAVTSGLSSLKSSGFSSFYNLIVLMGALEALRWGRIRASQAGIPQHCLFSLALPHLIRKTLQPFTPRGLMWVPDCWLRALAFTLPSACNRQSCIEGKLIPESILSSNRCCCVALNLGACYQGSENGQRKKQQQREEMEREKDFCHLLYYFFIDTAPI